MSDTLAGTSVPTGSLSVASGMPGPGYGPVGPAGPVNNLVLGTVTTGAPGSQAAVSITGTSPSQTLNITIPTGAQGPQGDQGLPGAISNVPSTPAGAIFGLDTSGAFAQIDNLYLPLGGGQLSGPLAITQWGDDELSLGGQQYWQHYPYQNGVYNDRAGRFAVWGIENWTAGTAAGGWGWYLYPAVGQYSPSASPYFGWSIEVPTGNLPAGTVTDGWAVQDLNCGTGQVFKIRGSNNGNAYPGLTFQPIQANGSSPTPFSVGMGAWGDTDTGNAGGLWCWANEGSYWTTTIWQYHGGLVQFGVPITVPGTGDLIRFGNSGSTLYSDPSWLALGESGAGSDGGQWRYMFNRGTGQRQWTRYDVANMMTLDGQGNLACASGFWCGGGGTTSGDHSVGGNLYVGNTVYSYGNYTNIMWEGICNEYNGWGNGIWYAFRWDGSTFYVAFNGGTYSNYVPLALGSGRALKSDIVPTSFDALAAINRIPLHEYSMRTRPDSAAQPLTRFLCGFIAEDIKDEIPNSVHTSGPDVQVGMPQWQPIVGALMRAVQQLTERVEQLEASR